ncbi:MAG: oligosaccharide flippase family protein [Nitrospirota bacterium]
MSDIFCSGLGFITTVILSKELSVKEFGVFMLSLSIVQTASTAACFGLDRSAVRFISYYKSKNNNDEAFGILKPVIYIMLLSSLSVAVFVYYGDKIFGENGFFPMIKSPVPYNIMAISAFFAALYSIVRPSLYGYKMFKHSALVQMLVDTVRLLSISLLVIYKNINVATVFIVFAEAYVAGIIMGLLTLNRFVKPHDEKSVPLSRSRIFQLISYSKWIFLYSLSAMLLNFTVLSMLERMINAEASGIYGLALSLTYIFKIISNAAISTYLPEVSEFNKTCQIKEYLKSSLKISIYCGLIFIPLTFLSKYIIVFIFGTHYEGSVSIFNILLLSYIPAYFNLTARLSLHAINKPEILAVTNAFSLLVMYFGCFYLIPLSGIIVPAYITFFTNACLFIYFKIYISGQISKGDSIFQTGQKRYFQ